MCGNGKNHGEAMQMMEVQKVLFEKPWVWWLRSPKERVSVKRKES